MGVVYRAIHPAIGKSVAIKIMNAKHSTTPGGVERFTREARAVAAIRHPGIVDVFGFGTLPDGRAYLIMEWLEGSSLARRITHAGLTLDESLDVLDQVARALEAAHAKGIIHRDLKPDNVFLEHVPNERPIVKILDFGLAKLVRDEGTEAFATLKGHTVGTPIYMSPEQFRAVGVDHRTDIYALGCIGYEIICGRLPFVGASTAELTASHLSEVPPRPSALKPDIPPALDELLFAMLDKDRANRPTLQQVRQTIAKLRAPTPKPAPEPPARTRTTPVYRRLVIVAIVIFAGGVAGYTATRVLPRRARPTTSPSTGSAIGSNVRAIDAGATAPRAVDATAPRAVDAAVGSSVDTPPPAQPQAQPPPAPQDETPPAPTPAVKPIKKPPIRPAKKAPVTVKPAATNGKQASAVDKPAAPLKQDPNAARTLNPFTKKKITQ
jgi:serine/threonine-protein kinase